MDTRILQSAARRLRLEPRNEPCWTKIHPGLSLGYRVGLRGVGSWVARRLQEERYQKKTLGPADDEAGGLSYSQAVEKAVAWMSEDAVETLAATYTMADACRDYIQYLTAQGKPSASTVAGSVRRYVEPHRIHRMLLRKLTPKIVRSWHSWVAEQPRRQRAQADISRDENIRRRRANANRILSQLKAALNLAYNENLAASKGAWDRVKPFQGVEPPASGS